MRLRCFLFAVIIFLSLQARAQIGIYGTFTGDHLSQFNPPYPYTGKYGYWSVGGGFGIYDDFAHLGPVRLGADLRANILNSKGHKHVDGLAGVRFVFKPPVVPLRPYLQASVGAGNTNFGGGNVTATGFQYQVMGGLDLTFLPRLDWRVVEVGGGGLHVNGTNYPLATVSTGIVFRLP